MYDPMAQDDDDMGPVGYTDSVHERIEIAAMAARCTWIWPNDELLAANATMACARIGMDYPGAIARMVIDLGASLSTARREMAASLQRLADRVYLQTLEGVKADEPAGDPTDPRDS
jgi:hypothetical protein